MVGGDMPGWLPSLFRRNWSNALTDRRGECVYAGCPPFRRFFIERASRASEHADLVVANHALVMLLAARGRDTGGAPPRPGCEQLHPLFDAADSPFPVASPGTETLAHSRCTHGREADAQGLRVGVGRGRRPV